MTLLKRDTLVDRPELVERGNGDDEEEPEDTQEIQTEILGDGGGPEINNLVFEPGDYNVVAGANAAAVLASGSREGMMFKQAFINSAIQLKNLKDGGEDIRDVGRFGLEKGIAELGLSEDEIDVLRQLPDEPDEVGDEEEEVRVESVDEEEIGDNIENIEKQLEEIDSENGSETASSD
jgi:hypothetical protein